MIGRVTLKTASVAMLLLAAGLLMAGTAGAQAGGPRLTINSIDSTNFPQTTAYMTVVDANGRFMPALTAADFTLSEDTRPIENFTVGTTTDQWISVVLVFDTSESIKNYGPETLGDMQRAANAFINGLDPRDQLGLVTFSNEAQQLTPELTTNHSSVIDLINGIETGGQTALYDGISTGIDMLKNLPPGRKAVVVLTDGQDDRSGASIDSIVTDAELFSIPVYTIGFGGVDEDALKRISLLTGGAVQVKPNSASLAEAFTAIMPDLRSQYVLSFASNLSADNTEHDLAITLTYAGGSQVSGTRKFVARAHAISISVAGLTAEGPNVVGGELRIAPQVTAPAAVERVEWNLRSADGAVASIAPPDVEAPFELVWDTDSVVPGDYVLQLSAIDAAGNAGIAEYPLTVRPAIRVTLSVPAPDDGLLKSPTVTVSAVVDAMAGIAKVDFYQGEILIGSDSDAPYAVEWDLRDLAPGSYTLKAVAYDVNNQSGENSTTVAVGTISTLGGGVVAIVLAIVVVAAILVFVLARRQRQKMGLEPAPGELAGGLALVEIQGLRPGQRWLLSQVEDTRLGRKLETNDIHVQGLSASRQHAVIRWVEEGYVLYNMRSDNPSYINNSPVPGQAPLAAGDRLQIGESVFRVEEA